MAARRSSDLRGREAVYLCRWNSLFTEGTRWHRIRDRRHNDSSHLSTPGKLPSPQLRRSDNHTMFYYDESPVLSFLPSHVLAKILCPIVLRLRNLLRSPLQSNFNVSDLSDCQSRSVSFVYAMIYVKSNVISRFHMFRASLAPQCQQLFGNLLSQCYDKLALNSVLVSLVTLIQLIL